MSKGKPSVLNAHFHSINSFTLAIKQLYLTAREHSGEYVYIPMCTAVLKKLLLDIFNKYYVVTQKQPGF